MADHSWVKEFPAGITVCDTEGIILEMNERSIEIFADDGGEQLVGTNVLDCHPEPSRSKLAEMMKTERRNIYFFEDDDERMMAFQIPWYQDGKYAGFVEMLLRVPDEIPHRR
jgi:transcriptional regulator with PAS, ATPase and Fis domain